MRFGVREICNVVFRAKSQVQIGNKTFSPGQPVLYIDSAKTSTLEGAATTVYATGGRGNTNLVAWEGEKTLTFTVEDALLSPISFAMLSGAGLIKGTDTEKVHVHTTSAKILGTDGALTFNLNADEEICKTAPIYVIETEEDGSLTGETFKCEVGTVSAAGSDGTKTQTITITNKPTKPTTVFVDYYLLKNSASVDELQIDAENFAGYYYVEADTLFRRQDTGKDMPANITLPNVKIQSNFTFTMASTGDPSTFTFTMDAFPGYTYFDNTKKVLCVIQVIDEKMATNVVRESVMDHKDGETIVGIDDEEGSGGTSGEPEVPVG